MHCALNTDTYPLRENHFALCARSPDPNPIPATIRVTRHSYIGKKRRIAATLRVVVKFENMPTTHFEAFLS